MADFVLLCRHVSRPQERALLPIGIDGDTGGNDSAEHASALEQVEELEAVAEILSDALTHQNLRLVAIRHASSDIATNHATWLKSKLAGVDASPSLDRDNDLHPDHFLEWSGPEPVDKMVKAWTQQIQEAPADVFGRAGAILVVGHMPQLGWLAARLTTNRPLWTRVLDGFATPLALKNGEVAALAITGTRKARARGHLEWTVAPDETGDIEQLRDKIKSKMDIAKLLGGFITLALGGVLLSPGRMDELSRGGDRWAVYVAAVAFLIAIGLYLRTMYAYDTLLMPRRYWGEAPPGSRPPRWLVRRPPSSAAWILYQNMVHIWTFLFTPATVAVAVGLLALAYAALDPGWVEGISAVVVLALFAVYGFWRRPILGSQD